MDHCEKEKRKTNPRENANPFSLLSFAYVTEILKKGYKKGLKEEDLYEVLKSCSSTRCGTKLQKYWKFEKEREQEKEKPILVSSMLWRRWGKRYIVFALINFLFNTILSVVKPYALSNLIASFAPGSEITRNQMYWFAFLVIFQELTNLVFMQNYIMWGQIFGTEIKTAFSSLLYRKALRLTPNALSEISLGNIVTLITKDVQTLRLSIWTLNECSIGVSQVCVICVLLYIKIGWVSFAGIGIMILALFSQIYITNWITKLRLQSCKKTDERLQITQEILSTMRIIKMYTWEAYFMKKLEYARSKEVLKLIMGFYLKMTLVLLGILSSKIGFYVLIIVCIRIGVTTDTTVILYVLSNFKDLRRWLGEAISYRMGQIGEFLSAYKRMVKALESEELNPDRQGDKTTDKPFVELKNATVKIKDLEILKDISFKITSGLTLITGTVGSGKSSLLKALLQDYPLTSGSSNIEGRISYSSQDPWLFPSSIKQNILFGQPYNENRYNEVLRICALLFDFNLLENGDETIVTDRGLNLSKGQQARINLARAVYRESEIYLLDDCLSALDAVVQEHIFNEVIKTFLKHKICVLITHNSSHISEANNVIIMDKGEIKDMGSPNENIYQEIKELIAEEDDLEKEIIMDKETDANDKTALLGTEQFTSKKKVFAEIKKEGSIGFDIYKKYFMYGGGILIVLLNFFMGGFTQFTTSYSDKLLTQWIDDKQTVINMEVKMNAFGSTNSSFNTTVFEKVVEVERDTFRLYSILTLGSTVLELFKTFLMVDFCRRSAVNIHKNMVHKIMNAVMSFFDTHFIGNILNRFSQDLVNIDENLPFTLNECYSIVFSVTGGILLILSVNLTFTIFILILFALLILIRMIYQPAGRSLKRLEASTRSPMIGHLNATLEGLTTIRACKVEDILIEEYDRHQDLHTSAYLISQIALRALGFFMGMVCMMLIIVVILKFLFFDTHTSAGIVALALTQVFAVSREINWGVRQWAELENLMTSVERLVEYTEIKTENTSGVDLENWPSKGAITYEQVSLSYNQRDECVLKNLNLQVNPSEKIGIVGRTGAGKSSIISTIFRLYEVQGKILIDGVDIKILSLDFLRKHIAIIPQDPVLFSGTIRSNLNPFNEFDDAEVWRALEKVGMTNNIKSLDQTVKSSNLNFSSGQKQLICLARAILRQHKIVIMDEPTANMDHETDVVLNKIIKENFSDATVLTIAHRLHSILDCDKVIVMDRGEIKEFNTPNLLLDNKDSMFYQMVRQAGLVNYVS